MARVHSFDTFSGIEIAYETNWGTVATTGWKRVHPVVDPGESGQLVRTQIPINQEFTAIGARTAYDYGRKTVQGSFSVIPAYNSEAFGILLRELHGGRYESHTAGKAPNGSTPGGAPSGYTSHAFFPQVYTDTTANYVGGVGKGLTIRVWKSGASDAGTIDRFVGCIITGLTWEQRASQPPVATFSFVGSQLSPLAASGLSLTAIPAGLVLMSFRDYNRQPTNQSVCLGASSFSGNALAMNSFTANITSGIEVPPSLITDPDTVSKPFHNGIWNITINVQKNLEDTYGGIHSIFTTDATAPGVYALIMRYVSETLAWDGGSAPNRMPYTFEFTVTGASLSDSRPNLSSVGVAQHALQFEGIRAIMSSSSTLITANQTVPWGLQLISTFASF